MFIEIRVKKDFNPNNISSQMYQDASDSIMASSRTLRRDVPLSRK
jgi:hypothetical protein